MRLYIQIIFTVSVALLFADQAYALGPAECNAYADEAMEQAQASKTLGCGFTGDQWGSYREGHLRWCRSADEDSVFKERLARTKLLEMCTPCADYADTALAKQRENLLYSCGGTGNRWSFNRAGHFYFCMATFQPGAGPPTPGLQAGSKLLAAIGSVAYQEQTAREASIASCKAKYNETEITKCTIYADQAVQAVQRLASTRPDLCGMRLDGRWSANRDQHFAWCIQKLRTPFEGEIQSEAEGRANDQKSCEDGSVEYGGRAAVGGSGGSTLRPEPSSGLSPFNAGKQIDAKPEIPSAGTAVSGKPMKEMGSRRASTAKVGTNTGGIRCGLARNLRRAARFQVRLWRARSAKFPAATVRRWIVWAATARDRTPAVALQRSATRNLRQAARLPVAAFRRSRARTQPSPRAARKTRFRNSGCNRRHRRPTLEPPLDDIRIVDRRIGGFDAFCNPASEPGRAGALTGCR